MEWERLSEIIEAGILSAISSILLGTSWGFLVLNTPYSICYLAVIIVPFISFYFASSVHEHFYGHYGGDAPNDLGKSHYYRRHLGYIYFVPHIYNNYSIIWTFKSLLEEKVYETAVYSVWYCD